MESTSALLAFAALSQPTRLAVFRLLIRHEPEGLAAGEIARLVDVPANTLSTHLGLLARANLISSERRSRLIIYRANLAAVQGLVSFLIEDCCHGHPEMCVPDFNHIAPCCSHETTSQKT